MCFITFPNFHQIFHLLHFSMFTSLFGFYLLFIYLFLINHNKNTKIKNLVHKQFQSKRICKYVLQYISILAAENPTPRIANATLNIISLE